MHPHDNIPYGFCHCGCGQKTKLSPRTRTALGYLKGQPTRYILGHQRAYRKTGPKPLPLEQRFWNQVDRSGECWIWTGFVCRTGYGNFAVKPGETKSAHRMSWMLTHGDIPDGMAVCHSCDKNYPAGDIFYRRCVRPDHLFLGTQKDNIRDMREKKREGCPDCHGEANGRAVLTDEQIVKIRQRHADGSHTLSALAREYGVSCQNISSIVKRRMWKHVP